MVVSGACAHSSSRLGCRRVASQRRPVVYNATLPDVYVASQTRAPCRGSAGCQRVWEGNRSEVGAMAAPAAADEVDTTRRKFLTFATATIGAVGVVATVVPFVESWNPSERARALGAPVEVDLSKMELGQLITSTWRRQVIYIVRRPQNLVDALPKNDSDLKDPQSKESNQPDYARNEMRSRTAEFLVMIGYCTHLGCLPKAFFDPG